MDANDYGAPQKGHLVFLPYVFRGLIDIETNFWDVWTPEEYIPTNTRFDSSPVLFIDTEKTDEEFSDLLQNIAFIRDREPQTIQLREERFDVMVLTGDGGFWTLLFLQEDGERLVRASQLESEIPTQYFERSPDGL